MHYHTHGIKKLLQSITISATALIVSVLPASAGPLLPDIDTIKSSTGLGDAEPTVVAATLIQAVLLLLGTIALVLIIYAGFTWMFARGNEEKVETARSILTAAIIGLVIIIGSYGIGSYIFAVINAAT